VRLEVTYLKHARGGRGVADPVATPATDDHITELMTRYATEPATTYAAELLTSRPLASDVFD
jgi:hypothetical protein